MVLVLAVRSPVLAASDNDLYILTWANYFDPAIAEEFKARTGISVKMEFFESDELRDDLLIANGAKGFDLILHSGSALETYRRNGWIARLDESLAPNLKHIDPRWGRLYPEARGYAVPYMWGTTGIAYRSDLVKTPITHWMQLFRPEDSLQGHITMVKDSRDIFSMALKALGYSANTRNEDELRAAGNLLMAQKPYVHEYSYITTEDNAGLLSGEVYAALIYNGDALILQNKNPAIRYVVPDEGTNIWTDYWSILESSPRRQNAMRFLDFINQPDIAARLTRYVHFATANKSAEKLLPPDILNNPVIYPKADVLQRSEVYRTLPALLLRYQNSIFSNLLR